MYTLSFALNTKLHHVSYPLSIIMIQNLHAIVVYLKVSVFGTRSRCSSCFEWYFGAAELCFDLTWGYVVLGLSPSCMWDILSICDTKLEEQIFMIHKRSGKEQSIEKEEESDHREM